MKRCCIGHIRLVASFGRLAELGSSDVWACAQEVATCEGSTSQVGFCANCEQLILPTLATSQAQPIDRCERSSDRCERNCTNCIARRLNSNSCNASCCTHTHRKLSNSHDIRGPQKPKIVSAVDQFRSERRPNFVARTNNFVARTKRVLATTRATATTGSKSGSSTCIRRARLLASERVAQVCSLARSPACSPLPATNSAAFSACCLAPKPTEPNRTQWKPMEAKQSEFFAQIEQAPR